MPFHVERALRPGAAAAGGTAAFLRSCRIMPGASSPGEERRSHVSASFPHYRPVLCHQPRMWNVRAQLGQVMQREWIVELARRSGEPCRPVTVKFGRQIAATFSGAIRARPGPPLLSNAFCFWCVRAVATRCRGGRPEFHVNPSALLLFAESSFQGVTAPAH